MLDGRDKKALQKVPESVTETDRNRETVYRGRHTQTETDRDKEKQRE